MFSFIKTLDMCESSISFTFFGRLDSIKEFKNYLQKNYLSRATFVYKDKNEQQGSVVLCINQVCSEKLKNLADIKNYIDDKF